MESNKCIPTRRLYYIDLAKAILIMMLILHHIEDVGVRVLQIENDTLLTIQKAQAPLILCYFMQAFFVITGACSNFNKNFKAFFIAQAKSLLLPAFVFVLINWTIEGGGFHSLLWRVFSLFIYGTSYWFLIAMFICKIIYFGMLRLKLHKYTLLFCLLVLNFIGTMLNQYDFFPNYLVHRHVFDMLLFLALGHQVRDLIISRKVLFCSLTMYLLVCFVMICKGIELPYVTYGYGTTIENWLIHVILASAGSFALLTLCSYFKREILLEYIGKNSLVIYLTQWLLLKRFVSDYYAKLTSNEMTESCFVVALIFICTLSIGLLVAYILNNTKARVILGKF